jgi:hypothetical protein
MMVIGRRRLASVVVMTALVGGWSGGRTAEAAVVLGGTTGADEIFSITFDTVGVVNPIATFSDVPGIGGLTVSFGTHFLGQTRGSSYNSLSDTVPTSPLTLDPSGKVKTMFDLSSASGIMLGGVEGLALYTTPLAVLFSDEVSYVAFDLGYFDGADPLIEAFDSQGNSLGVFGDLPLGHNRYSLADSNGENVIAGISVYVPDGGLDLEGFGLNNFQFAAEGDGVIPEPSTLAVWSLLVGCAASAAWWKRRRGATMAS